MYAPGRTCSAGSIVVIHDSHPYPHKVKTEMGSSHSFGLSRCNSQAPNWRPGSTYPSSGVSSLLGEENVLCKQEGRDDGPVRTS